MSTMYNRSLVMFEQSKNALGKIADDNAYLDVACFEAQQAIEFLMKAPFLLSQMIFKPSCNCSRFPCTITTISISESALLSPLT